MSSVASKTTCSEPREEYTSLLRARERNILPSQAHSKGQLMYRFLSTGDSGQSCQGRKQCHLIAKRWYNYGVSFSSTDKGVQPTPEVSKAGIMSYLSQHSVLHIHNRDGIIVVCIKEEREFLSTFSPYLQNPILLFLLLKPFLTLLPKIPMESMVLVVEWRTGIIAQVTHFCLRMCFQKSNSCQTKRKII